ncbi:MAG: metalloregulator ArsR/SmtB family transcription factor [Planctomycetota bacterium]
MSTTTPQNATARLFKCLSEGLRLRLVRLLAEEELNVNELQSVLGVPQSTLSRHLGVLRDGGLLTTRREGSWIFHRLTAPEGLNGSAEHFLSLLRDMIADDENAADDREGLDRVLEARRLRDREHFEKLGHTWDELNRRIADPAIIDRALLRLLPQDLTVVDAGTGSGYLLPMLAATGARVIAIDHTPAQLQKARMRAEAEGLSNIEFREGDISALPLEDASVDAVFAHLVLHHTPRPEAAIMDLSRVLKPGAALVVTDFKSHQEAWLREEHADLWLGFEPEDVAAWMRAAGLEDVRTEERTWARANATGSHGTTPELEVFVMSGHRPRHSQRSST